MDTKCMLSYFGTLTDSLIGKLLRAKIPPTCFSNCLKCCLHILHVWSKVAPFFSAESFFSSPRNFLDLPACVRVLSPPPFFFICLNFFTFFHFFHLWKAAFQSRISSLFVRIQLLIFPPSLVKWGTWYRRIGGWAGYGWRGSYSTFHTFHPAYL